MDYFFEYLAAFFLGLFVKLTDAQADEKVFSLFHKMQYLTAVAYGLLAGFLSTASPDFAAVFLAVAVGVLLGKKIDHPSHQFAFAAIFVVFALRGVPAVSLAPFALLVVAGFADEFFSDWADRQKQGIAKKVFEKRFLLEVAGLGLSVATGNWVFFLSILLFDAGYHLVEWLAARQKLPAEVRGHELLLDLYQCSRSKLDDLGRVYKFLDELPGKIGMKKISKPLVVRYEHGNKRENGISGIVLIAESHVSVHTYPNKELAKIDVYSCKEFDEKRVATEAKKWFGARKAEAKLFKRGIEHLADLEEARKIVEAERQNY